MNMQLPLSTTRWRSCEHDLLCKSAMMSYTCSTLGCYAMPNILMIFSFAPLHQSHVVYTAFTEISLSVLCFADTASFS